MKCELTRPSIRDNTNEKEEKKKQIPRKKRKEITELWKSLSLLIALYFNSSWFPFIQITYGSHAPSLTGNRYLFRTIPSTNSYNDPRIKMCIKWEWKNVGILGVNSLDNIAVSITFLLFTSGKQYYQILRSEYFVWAFIATCMSLYM